MNSREIQIRTTGEISPSVGMVIENKIAVTDAVEETLIHHQQECIVTKSVRGIASQKPKNRLPITLAVLFLGKNQNRSIREMPVFPRLLFHYSQ